MNIFALDSSPERAARMHCDRHVVKMVLESAQLLSTALHLRDPRAAARLMKRGLCYRPTHQRHPCTLWVLSSRGNHAWLLRLALALSAEYTYRYGREHASAKVIRALNEQAEREALDAPGASGAAPWTRLRRTPFAQAMPEQYRGDDPVVAYRLYYIAEKAPICRWTKRKTPHFSTYPIHSIYRANLM